MGINSNSSPVYSGAKSSRTFQDGLEFQDFVGDKLAEAGIEVRFYASKKYQYERGESAQGYEIKLDARSSDTGRLSIEIAEKTHPEQRTWSPSGIYRHDNTIWYVQGHFGAFFVFSKPDLLNIHQVDKPKEHEEYGTVRAFYLSMTAATQVCCELWRQGVGWR